MSKKSHAALKIAATWFTGILVLAGVLWTAWRGYADLQRQPFAWSEFRVHWFVFSIFLYFLGMVPSWIFWRLTMLRFGRRVSWWQSFRAFYISQLGKYVPGKVMVIALRTAIVCQHLPQPPCVEPREGSLIEAGIEPPKDQASAAAGDWVLISATAAMETLTFIAVGAAVGVLAGSYFFSDRLWLLLIAALIGIALPVPILPPVFVWLMQKSWFIKDPRSRQLIAEKWTWSAFLSGCLILPWGWLLLGTSMMALLASLPGSEGASVSVSDFPRALAAISLANVLGFVSLIPGGFGVREVVLYPILGPRFASAIVIVVLYRFASLAAEVLAAALAALPALKRPFQQA